MATLHETDLNECTPNKKRKRSCTLDTYISSTPKFTTKDSKDYTFDNPALDLCIPSPKHHSQKKVEHNVDLCMEVKSISDLVGKAPYEIVRKPPKKKKRTVHDIEENCFVNEGLNLNVVEKNPVNPFEVKRPNENSADETSHCFVNSGLNIRGPESNINPFEVARDKNDSTDTEKVGIDNLGLEEQPTLSIGLPFTPTVNRRINFKNISPNSLHSPSTMLAKTLVFSPEENKSMSIKRASQLSVISEESVLDIDKELDHYQLELENSINEAKTRKDKNCRSLMERKHISNLAMKLKNLKENHTIDEHDGMQEQETRQISIKSSTLTIELVEKEVRTESSVRLEQTPHVEEKNVSAVEDVDGVQYEEVNEEDDSRIDDDDDDFDFKNPAPFKRAYRRSTRVKKEQQHQDQIEKENVSTHSHNFIKDIRKSIRKLIHPTSSDDSKKSANQPTNESSHHGLLSTIRQSFRRKPKTVADSNCQEMHDVSIIDESEKRQIFRQPESDMAGCTQRKSRRHKKIYF